MSNHEVTNEAQRYGGKYWCVKLTNGDTIMAAADRIETPAAGGLVLLRAEGNLPNIGFAAGVWQYFYAADLRDGSAVAVAVEHWTVEAPPPPLVLPGPIK